MWSKRIAVSSFFFVNGFLYASWTSRLPEIQRFFNIGNAQLGTLLFVLAIGALISMPFSGWLTTRLGSHRITQIAGLVFCALVMLITIYPDIRLVSVIFVFVGLASGAMDVAMNGQAVYVERLWNKPIMSSFHAVFSIGMALGAAAGALFAKFHFQLQTHFMIVGGVGLLWLIFASIYLIKDEQSESKSTESESHFVLPTKAILPLGIIGFCGMTGEGSMADWSAIYMNKVLQQTEAFGAIAFGAFGVAMTIGRIFGDYFTLKLGKRKLLIIDSVLSVVGLGIVLSFSSEWLALGGFFLVGLGLSTVVPIVYSTAGNTEGVIPSVGIAMATTIGYAGFFVGPPTIGFLADTFGLRIGLCFSLTLFLIMLFLVSRVKIKD
ncbi:MAG: MFS transporter [Spirosomataceae bacterium]